MEVLQQSGRSELEETLKRLQQHKAELGWISHPLTPQTISSKHIYFILSPRPKFLSSRGVKGVTGVIVVNGTYLYLSYQLIIRCRFDVVFQALGMSPKLPWITPPQQRLLPWSALSHPRLGDYSTISQLEENKNVSIGKVCRQRFGSN